MPETLTSPFWYRVAELRPALRDHVRVHRHRYRGERWYVLEDTASGRHHRVHATAYRLVAGMDGTRSLDAIWRDVLRDAADEAPSQGETIALLAHLHSSDMLRTNVTPDTTELFERFWHGKQTRGRSPLRSPLSMRLPLFDPDVFLQRALPWLAPVLGRIGLAGWATTVALGALLAASHWSELTSSPLDHALDPRGLLLILLAYPLVKALHELGHAFATKAFGGEVHELGVMFLILMPVPYVDASAASAFPDKRSRMLVGAAGVMVELFLAALAVFVWLAVEPGLVRTLAWNVIAIGGVSTLVFNGNPLLRFDGYYVLADAIELPNLAPRAARHLAYLFQHHLLGLPERRPAALTAREGGWLIAYGLGSVAYRTAVLFGIALLVASRFFFVGVVLAIAVVAGQLVVPAARSLARLRRDPRVRAQPLRSAGAAAAVAAAAALLVFAVPFPTSTRTEGVVWPPDEFLVRAGADGFIRRVLVAPDALVAPGTGVIETEDPEAETRVRVLAARHRELETRYHALRLTNLAKAEALLEQVGTAAADLERARGRFGDRIVRSPATGRLELPSAENLPGRFVRRGDVLGFVTGDAAPIVRVVVPHEDVAHVRDRTRAIEVRLAHGPGEVLPARVQREVPAGDKRLPSLALGSRGGGRLAMDARDARGLEAVERVFQLDLALLVPAKPAGVGERAYVRFDTGGEPLAAQIVRALRRLFLRRFGV